MNVGEIRISTKIDNSGIKKDWLELQKTFDKLSSSHKIQTQDISAQEKALEKLVAAYEKMAGSPAIKAMNAELKDAAVSAEKVSKALGDSAEVEAIKQEIAQLNGELEKSKAESEQMAQSLATIRTASERLPASATATASAYDKSLLSIQKQEQAITELQQKLDAISTGAKRPTSLVALESSIRALQKELDPAIAKMDELAKRYNSSASAADRNSLAAEMDKLDASIAAPQAKLFELERQLEALKLSPESSTEAQNLAEKIKLAEINLENSRNRAAQLKEQMQEVGVKSEKLSSKTDVVKKNLTGSKEQAVRFASAMKSLGDSLKGIGKQSVSVFKSMLRSLARVTQGTHKTSNGFRTIGSRMKSIVLSAAVFSVISRALATLRESLGKTLMANKEFAASFNALKVNSLTAFAPIWEVLQPALISFMNVLARVMATVAAFVSMLFGKSVSQSKALAKGYNDQAKGIGAVGSAAKKASKLLLDFDEIQKISAEPEDSGGGGSGGAGGGLDFGGAPETIGWIEELKAKLAEITDPFMWGFEIGTALGEQLEKMLDMINWDAIQAKTEDIALRISGLLAGAIFGIPWEKLGSHLGEGFNTALLFLSTILERTPWGALGRKLAQGLNKMVATIDWKLLGKTLALKWQALIDVFYNFVSTFDWGAFGKSIADAVNSWFETIDWAQAGETIKLGFTGALTTLTEAVKNIEWRKVGEDIRAFLVALDWKEIASAVVDVAKAAFSGFFNLIFGLADSPETLSMLVTLGTIIAGIAISIGVLSAAIAVYNIVMAIANVVSIPLFLTILAIVAAVVALIAIIVLLVVNWEWIKEKATQIWGAIKQFLIDTFELIKRKITEIWEGIKHFFHATWTNIKNTAIDIFNAIKDWIVNKFTETKDKATEIWENIKKTISDIITNLKESFEEKFTAIKEAVVGAFNGIWSGIKGIIDDIIGGVEKMVNTVIDGVNLMIGAINSFSIDVPKTPKSEAFTIGFNIPTLNNVSLPRLAKGGVLKRGQVGLLEGDGAEAVVPLENNRAWLKALSKDLAPMLNNFHIPAQVTQAIVAQETERRSGRISGADMFEHAMLTGQSVAASGGNGGGNIIIEANADIGALIRLLDLGIKKEDNRTGSQYSNRVVVR